MMFNLVRNLISMFLLWRLDGVWPGAYLMEEDE